MDGEEGLSEGGDGDGEWRWVVRAEGRAVIRMVMEMGDEVGGGGGDGLRVSVPQGW